MHPAIWITASCIVIILVIWMIVQRFNSDAEPGDFLQLTRNTGKRGGVPSQPENPLEDVVMAIRSLEGTIKERIPPQTSGRGILQHSTTHGSTGSASAKSSAPLDALLQTVCSELANVSKQLGAMNQSLKALGAPERNDLHIESREARSETSDDFGRLIGQEYVTHCREANSSLSRDEVFLERLKRRFGETSVTVKSLVWDASLSNSTPELLASERAERTPMRDRRRYWLVEYSQQYYLVPEPKDRRQFSHLSAFFDGPEVQPETIGEMLPALLILRRPGEYRLERKGQVSLATSKTTEQVGAAPPVQGNTMRKEITEPCRQADASTASVLGERFIEFCGNKDSAHTFDGFRQYLQKFWPDDAVRVEVVYRHDQVNEFSGLEKWKLKFGARACWLVRIGQQAFLLPALIDSNQLAFLDRQSFDVTEEGRVNEAGKIKLEECVAAMTIGGDNDIWKIQRKGRMRYVAEARLREQNQHLGSANPDQKATDDELRKLVGESFVQFCSESSKSEVCSCEMFKFYIQQVHRLEIIVEQLDGNENTGQYVPSRSVALERMKQVASFGMHRPNQHYWVVRQGSRQAALVLPVPEGDGRFRRLIGFKCPEGATVETLIQVTPAVVKADQQHWSVVERGEVVCKGAERQASPLPVASSHDEHYQRIGRLLLDFCREGGEVSSHEQFREYLRNRADRTVRVFPVWCSMQNGEPLFRQEDNAGERYWVVSMNQTDYLLPAPKNNLAFVDLSAFGSNSPLGPIGVESLVAGGLRHESAGKWSLERRGSIG
jgi:hypothetical protein